MRNHHFVLAAALVAPSLTAQNANDVGLTMSGGLLPVIYGRNCGPYSCQPFQAGPVGAGTPYDVVVYGAPLQPFALAADIDTGPACLQFPGIANALSLPNLPVTLAIGQIGIGNPSGVCNQGRAVYVLQFPVGTPPGVAFLLQGLADSVQLGAPAFTVAIRSTT